jgi:iron complex transport system permease protein
MLLSAVAVLLVCPFFGSVNVFSDETGSAVLWNIRVPRILTAFMAGAALSLSGMAFQTLFRNPLATPFTLGISGGAALGATLWLRLGLTAAWFGAAGTSLSGFIGALGAVSLVYGLTRLQKGFQTPVLLLAGIAINLFFSSLILLLQYFSDPGETFRIIRWLMGGFFLIGYRVPLTLLPFILAGTALMALLTREMNLLLSGEEMAGARGLHVERTKKLIFFSASLMTGSVVAFCGPIGFVGMMSPHICRLLVGANHRHLTPASFLFGGMFLVLCDTLARTLVPPSEIPVGVITALLGGPFFLWLLLSRKSDLEI